MQGGLFRFVWRQSGRDQILLSVLTVAVFLLNTLPLELQRRVVNEAIADRQFAQILLLGGIYAGVELLHGLLKFLMNVYRGWVNENVTRQLRRDTERAAAAHAGGHPSGAVAGAAIDRHPASRRLDQHLEGVLDQGDVAAVGPDDGV